MIDYHHMKTITDLKQTLRLLQERGRGGIHSFELMKLVGTNRAAARIRDLRKLGYIIESVPEKRGDSNGVRYTLATQQNIKQKVYTFDKERNVYVVEYV